MHLELTQILICPHCGPPNGLVAFVNRMEERRIVEGRLDCPVCERRHAVREGRVLLGDGVVERGDTADDEPAPEAGRATVGPRLPDAAPTAAALLGPPEGAEVLLLAGGAEPLAAELADLRPEAALVTFGPAPAGRHPRVHPVVPSAAGSAGSYLPFRPGSFGGAVLTGGWPDLPAAVAPALTPGARLVVLAPRDGTPGRAGPPLRELASDARAWVGVRT